MTIVLDIVPVAKPRMTQRDRWCDRKCVHQYWEFKDEVLSAMKGLIFPHPAHIVFILPMPASWSKKKKHEYDGLPHCQRPDWDNLAKGLTDALFDEDSHLFDIRVTKLWGKQGKIIINPLSDPVPRFLENFFEKTAS